MNEKKLEWIAKQNQLKKLLITDELVDNINYIGGVDISFIKGDSVNACACLIVMDATMNIIYKKCEMIKLNEPYMAGFLAFREVDFLVELVNEFQKSNNIDIDVIFVDGNGILHPQGFGIASHLGVLTNTSTIGIGKKLLNVDGLTRDSVKDKFNKNCKKIGDFIELRGDSGKIWGAAVLNTTTKNDHAKPIFVSIGHKIGLKQALKLTREFSQYRVPEPVRIADLESRDYIRKIVS